MVGRVGQERDGRESLPLETDRTETVFTLETNTVLTDEVLRLDVSTNNPYLSVVHYWCWQVVKILPNLLPNLREYLDS